MNRSVVVASLLVLACGGGGAADDPSAPSGSPNNSGGAPSRAEVQMRANSGDYTYGAVTYAFAPSAVTVARGGAVTWTNTSGTVHNVTFGGGAGAPSNLGNFGSGSGTRTFNTAGTFSYECTIHDGMSGSVQVR
ncbi:MAG: cupredoxin domain-containing protein [Gemmatimonadota bacterium]